MVRTESDISEEKHIDYSAKLVLDTNFRLMLCFREVAFSPYIFTIPLSTYAIIWFRSKTKDEMFATKRSTVLFYGLTISLWCSIVASAYLQAAICFIDVTVLTSLWTRIGALIYILSWYSILYFLTIRIWLLYFKYNWQYYSLQSKWQQLINKNIVESSQKINWFVHNSHKYGNVKYVTKRGIIFAVFGYIWYILTLGFQLPSILVAPGFICILLYILFYIIILCKTPYQKDTYFIHWETKMHSRLLFGCFLVMAIIVMVLRIWGYQDDDNAYVYIIASTLHPSISSIFCVMILVSTYIMLKKNTTNVVIQHKSMSDTKEQYSVELLLSNEKSVNLFMKYLAKEYSMECMLSFIEMSQYQNYLIQNDSEQAINSEIITKVRARSENGFAKNIPISEIIEPEFNSESDDQIFEFKIKAYNIYKKYVQVGSEFEINVSSLTRSKLKYVADLSSFLNVDTSINDLVMMFEECRIEMRLLLMYSLARFKATKEFEEIEQIFDKNIEKEIVIQRQSTSINIIYS